MPADTDPSLQFDSIEDTIKAFNNGEFIIVLDSQDRENEGDLIIAADSITPAQMAFLVRFTSGLICAPVSPEIANRLSLPQMVLENADPKGTAYTISVDSSDPSVTTGISAQDRALACRTLASPTARAEDFRRPGHIIPLQARSGGVRERRGHTEAAVEFCRLTGKVQAGVIAELVEDGELVPGVPEIGGNNGMMRRDGCLKFGKKWGIKVCTIEDLVEYVEKTEGSSVVTNGKQ
ncbi:DHBP synthase RibB-like alpha/beta domain-containing protein [Aspergillus caelatus]|uniref:3,4-dihydroxy-2-butanone 4-phosphate synthase n=1 Tax=Aspergillus caelatus TaxID=61420 RepID=A0A5N7AFY1_9EURO|nr:DHBP synthase RibB-like alpha/beta domain-containing protein [Aspergillus caelatus]KAE8368732.1 DHBP synthase RibB-like alpha/beta domain-containing protein [Aspergillus caelatus]